MSDPKLERLIAYLRENTGRYSLQSLRDQLLKEGYEPDLINQAIAELDRRQHAVAGSPAVWPYVLLAVLINSGLAAFAGMAALSVPMHHSSDTGPFHFTAALFLVEAVCALLVLLNGKLRRLGCGILGAVLVGSAVGLLSFVGYCAVNL